MRRTIKMTVTPQAELPSFFCAHTRRTNTEETANRTPPTLYTVQKAFTNSTLTPVPPPVFCWLREKAAIVVAHRSDSSTMFQAVLWNGSEICGSLPGLQLYGRRNWSQCSFVKVF